MAKKKRKAPTPNLRTKRIALEFIKNGGKNMGRAMKIAGCSPNMCKNPQRITETKAFQKEIKPFVDLLQEEMNQALDAMRNKMKRKKTNYRDLAIALNLLSKTKKDFETEPGNDGEVIFKWRNK